MSNEIYTIGHSTNSFENFVQLLHDHGITAVADVRSAPYSRHNPQFNREELRSLLKLEGIRYVFLGKELGARSDDEACYLDDKVQYTLLAKTQLFQAGIERVMKGAKSYKIALMCAEKDPLDCHRTILVARELVNRGSKVNHILVNGLLEPHPESMSRLLKQLRLGEEEDMFKSKAMTIDEAYDKQSQRIAYVRKREQSGTEKYPKYLATERQGR